MDTQPKDNNNNVVVQNNNISTKEIDQAIDIETMPRQELDQMVRDCVNSPGMKKFFLSHLGDMVKISKTLKLLIKSNGNYKEFSESERELMEDTIKTLTKFKDNLIQAQENKKH